jgi:hypothetical protein
MAAAETVAWVKPFEPIRGIDHLVHAPCRALYSLTGISSGVESTFRSLREMRPA